MSQHPTGDEIPLKEKKTHHEQHLETEHEDHEEHIDERWLVSYADMMTLLFGLFVLLYSMATMDKNEAQKVIESTNEKFGGASQLKTPKKTVNYQKLYEELMIEKEKIQQDLQRTNREIKNTQDLKKQLDVYSQKIESLENIQSKNKKLSDEVSHLNSLLKDLEKQQKSKKDQSLKTADYIRKIDTLDKTLQEKSAELTRLEQENLKLKQSSKQIAQLNQRDVATQEKSEQKLAALDAKLKVLEETKVELLAKQADKDSQLSRLSTENQSLSEQLKKYEMEKTNGAASKAFLAVFINWSTRDHDIDLVIKDPRGKKFDFKNRKHSGYPGLFALDTRRGPGAELWQTDKIIPGKYTASYSFYNQYGNTESAKVSGTIYSAKGSFEIKTVQMDLGKNKEFHIFFEVADDGGVRILNTTH